MNIGEQVGSGVEPRDDDESPLLETTRVDTVPPEGLRGLPGRRASGQMLDGTMGELVAEQGT